MAITPVAYYTGATIPGTEQVGNLSIGTTSQDYGIVGSNNGITYISSPEQSGGYIIAHVALGRPVASGATGNGNVGFWKTPAKTDESFLNFVNALFLQSLASASAAKTYLNNNGYWTDWAPSGPPPFTGNVGDLYGGGIVGYIYQSGDPGYDAGTQHGIILSVGNNNNPIVISAENNYNQFNLTGNESLGTSPNLGSGTANTLWLEQNPSIVTMDPSLIFVPTARNYNAGGFTDWVIPSSGDMEKINNSVWTNINGNGNFYMITSTINGFFSTGFGFAANIVSYAVDANYREPFNGSILFASGVGVLLVRYF